MLALIIEDETSLRIIYRRVLEEVGFEVIEAADGIVALELLAAYTPQIIYLDMLLPGTNGATVLNHIVTDERLKGTHTVIVSSNKQFEKMHRPDLGITFVLKPIRPAQIRELALSVPDHL